MTAFLCTLVIAGSSWASQEVLPDTADADAALAQSADEETVDTALNLIRSGDVDQGVFILQRLAGQGNADSLFHLGEMFRLGIGREKTNTVATMYYRLAAALNHKRASLSLANMLFFEGDGSDKVVSEALGVWQNLALDGDVESIYMLGMIYWNGEAGLEQDPVRGYGLVWRAAQEGYADAVQNELTMRSLLNAEARDAAHEYGQSLHVEGFSAEPLAIELVKGEEATPDEGSSEEVVAVADATALPADGEQEEPEVETPPEPVVPLEKPEDWETVWRLEVGHAMSEVEVRRLQSIINQTMGPAVGQLFSEISPSATRPGLYRLVFGPMRSMSHAVSTCVTLKRGGHECATRAPE